MEVRRGHRIQFFSENEISKALPKLAQFPIDRDDVGTAAQWVLCSWPCGCSEEDIYLFAVHVS